MRYSVTAYCLIYWLTDLEFIKIFVKITSPLLNYKYSSIKYILQLNEYIKNVKGILFNENHKMFFFDVVKSF